MRASRIAHRASRMLLEEGTFVALSLESPTAVARLGQRGRDYEGQTVSIPEVTVDSLGLSPRVVKMDLQGWNWPRCSGCPAAS